MAIMLQRGRPYFDSRRDQETSFRHPIQTCSGGQSAVCPAGVEDSLCGTRATRIWSWPLKWQVKNAWSSVTTPSYAFLTLCLIKHQRHLHLLCFTINEYTRKKPSYRCRFLHKYNKTPSWIKTFSVWRLWRSHSAKRCSEVQYRCTEFWREWQLSFTVMCSVF